MKSKIEARQSFVNITKCNVKSLCVITTFIMLILSLHGQKDKKTSLSIRVGLKDSKSLLSIRVSFAQSSLPRVAAVSAVSARAWGSTRAKEKGALLSVPSARAEQEYQGLLCQGEPLRKQHQHDASSSSSSSNIRDSLRNNRSEQQNKVPPPPRQSASVKQRVHPPSERATTTLSRTTHSACASAQ